MTIHIHNSIVDKYGHWICCKLDIFIIQVKYWQEFILFWFYWLSFFLLAIRNFASYTNSYALFFEYRNFMSINVTLFIMKWVIWLEFERDLDRNNYRFFHITLDNFLFGQLVFTSNISVFLLNILCIGRKDGRWGTFLL